MEQTPKNLEHCPISYELTRIRLGAGPEERPGFWTAYQEMLEFNRATNYKNNRIRICSEQLAQLGLIRFEN